MHKLKASALVLPMHVPRRNSAAQKTILLLTAGLALSLSYSPRGQYRILRAAARKWKTINQQSLNRAIQKLYESRLVGVQKHEDGSLELILTEKGKRVALRYKLEEMTIAKPDEWDQKWRIVMFDIPEKHRVLRDALRQRLQRIGCVELQKSVFVHPYDCHNEIEFLIELYGARRHVRFIEATYIDNMSHLKTIFRIA